MPDLLIELFSEEIPARMQAKAAADLRRLMTDGLVEAGLTYRDAAAFATPRRLALSVEGLTEASRGSREERKGPAVGAPDKAVEGFARSAGVAREALQLRDAAKGQAWFAVIDMPGRTAPVIVAEVLERTVRNFPWPKSMRWGSGSLRWVRPLQSILCILSDESGTSVVPVEIDGLRAGRATRGHRFLSAGEIEVSSFDDYEAKLKRAHVILRPEARAEAIWHDATTLAFARGVDVIEDPGLLAEVAGLVEWPVVLMGEIGEAFLDLPPEVLQTSMKDAPEVLFRRSAKRRHSVWQAYGKRGRITHFVTVANIETEDTARRSSKGNAQGPRRPPVRREVLLGERPCRGGSGMEAWRAGLEAVTFHEPLGSQADRIARIAALAREIAPMVGADPATRPRRRPRSPSSTCGPRWSASSPNCRASWAATTPRPPASRPRSPPRLEEHYSPLGPSDAVPTAPVSVAVALADKIDTLTGFWAIDEKPTGSKDPFALRRAALGVIRLVLANELRSPIRPVLILNAIELAVRGRANPAVVHSIKLNPLISMKLSLIGASAALLTAFFLQGKRRR